MMVSEGLEGEDKMPAAEPKRDLQGEHHHSEAKRAIAVTASMTIVAAGDQRATGEDHGHEQQSDRLAGCVLFLVGGFRSDHPPRLVPVADRGEEDRLAMPCGGFDSQRARSSPARRRSMPRARPPFRANSIPVAPVAAWKHRSPRLRTGRSNPAARWAVAVASF